MNDRQLENLIRMALEAEALEASAQPARRPRPPAWRRAAGGLAAAACLAGALTIAFQAHWNKTTPAPIPNSTQGGIASGTRPVTITQIEAPDAETDSIVLAVFRDNGEEDPCVQMELGSFCGARNLADIDRTELLLTAFENACTPTPGQVVVLALSGPRGTLPRNQEEAAALASCIIDAPDACAADGACVAQRVRRYLPPDVSIVAESLALGR